MNKVGFFIEMDGKKYGKQAEFKNIQEFGCACKVLILGGLLRLKRLGYVDVCTKSSLQEIYREIM